jgi:queuine tRNA-ribosyltransferase
LRGDFLQMMDHASAPPDVIFYDMFSSKTSADAWKLETFRRLFAACEGRAVELFTYTCSTWVRAALLAAGFYVAKGRSTGPKDETTIAFTPAAYRTTSRARHELLASAWLERWNRSGAKFPPELAAIDQQPAFEQTIREHAQFRR